MKILAFDTALFACTAAVLDTDSGACFKEVIRTERGQAEELVPMIERVMKKAAYTFDQIDMIGTTVGPGAFTGLRIGLSTARALGLALGKPVVGVTTLEVLARRWREDGHALPDNSVLAVIIETKRTDFYIQTFDGDGHPLSPPSALSAPEAVSLIASEKAVLIGDAVGRFIAGGTAEAGWRADTGYEIMDPEILARLAAEKEPAEGRAEPLYLREADVTMPKKKQRVITGNI